jgi:hypothetical protein
MYLFKISKLDFYFILYDKGAKFRFLYKIYYYLCNMTLCEMLSLIAIMENSYNSKKLNSKFITNLIS